MKATSSGICVICTVRARYRPSVPPTTSAAAIQPTPPALTRGPNTVASTAIAMPIMP